MRLLTLLLVTVLMTACAPQKNLIFNQYGQWQVTAINNQPIQGLHNPTMIFSGNSITGSGGCNRYHATLEQRGAKFRIGPTASTKMACPGQAAAIEMHFLQILGTLNDAVRSNNRLILNGTNGNSLTLEPLPS